MEPVELQTSRLTLRAPTAVDVQAITAACQDPEIPRWTTVPSPYDPRDAEDFVRLVAERWENGTQTVWTAYADGVLVASIGLHHISEHATGGDAELGYWVAAP